MGACWDNEEESGSNQTEPLTSRTSNKLSISILTWNVGTSEPNDSIDVLFRHKNSDADICVIGLEEVVELTVKNAIIDDDKNDELWQKKINMILNETNNEYSFLKALDMVGVLLLIFVKNSIKNEIQNVLAEKSETGMLSVVGNKGGVGIRFSVYDTSICFVCCHLAAHKDEVDERNEDYHEILKELTFEDEKEESILNHDVVFIFGDLNYRLNFEADQLQNVYDLIDNQKWAQLLEKDQLLDARKNNKVFEGFNEEKINFQPTYKFEPGTNDYEQKKKRMPSYCDRILWKVSNNKTVRCLKYDTYLEQKLSDHKPVVGLYQLG